MPSGEYPKSTLWLDDPVHGLIMAGGHLAGHESGKPTLTGQQLYILRSIALASASMSVVSGVLVGWWFARMKRSFRHHLIMLLVFSDFFKSAWQLIYPAVVLTRGAVTSQSRFCQASGFLLAMGVEASDFAVLAIAVHTALYIFRPGMGAIGEGGLFRYRYYVYALWLAFCLIMPSLAFINSAPAYSAQGTFCYLPVRPLWYRLALAWIPRYAIILIIMILYASIYIYVRMKFRTFKTNVGASTLDVDTIDLAPADQSKNTPRLPSLEAHGLIPPSPAVDSRQPSNSGDQPFPKALLAPFHDNDRTNPSSSSNSQINGSTRDSVGIHSGHLDLSATKSRQMSQGTANAEARRRRIAISRQLRLLFIYPLFYALMWVPPLVLNALQFTDHYIAHPSFPLACVVAFTMPFQCFIDCWLFTIREKPWRYIPEGHRGRWFARYGFGFGRYKGKSAEIGAEEGGDAYWRNRKHMSFEARKAYERREAEKEEAEEERLGRVLERGRPHRERRWWDHVEGEILEEAEDSDSDTEVDTRSLGDELSRMEHGPGDGDRGGI